MSNLISQIAGTLSYSQVCFDHVQHSTRRSLKNVFFTATDLNDAPIGTVIEAKWLAALIERHNPGEIIYGQVIKDFTKENFTGRIYFQLSNDNCWPAGEYKVDLYLNGTFV